MEERDLIHHAIVSSSLLFGEEMQAMEREAFMEWLRQKVQDLLDHDFNRLVSLLYRIDVYESKAKDCFGKSNKEIAACLAKLIWERELQKVKSRFNNGQ